MKKQKSGFGISVGSSSILVVFVVLCLTTFATLSLVSANADYRLSRKTADAVNEYYEAEIQANEHLAAITQILDDYKPEQPATKDELDYLMEAAAGKVLTNENNGQFAYENDKPVVTYEVPVGADRILRVKLDVSGYYGPGEKTVKVAGWQVAVPAEEEFFDDMGNLPVFTTDALPAQ